MKAKVHRNDPTGGQATHPAPVPVLDIASLPNLRDVGGQLTGTGARVRTGLVYRSTALARLDPADAPSFATLGVRTVYDLRTAHERAAAPDRLPPATELVVADVLGAKVAGSPAYLIELLARPDRAEAALGGARGRRLWIDQYRDFVRLDSARAAYGSLFRGIACEACRPVLFHCSTGKDRTGWAAATLLRFLGVPDDAVMADYLASATLVAPMLRSFADDYAARGGNPELIVTLFATLPDYLDAALDQVDRTYGDIEGYVAHGLGIDAARRTAIREALLD